MGYCTVKQNYQALLLDLSGVLHDGSHVIEGALETVEQARQRGITLRFVTNTATKAAATIVSDLAGMGFDVNREELFTAPIAAKSYAQQRQLKPYCLVHSALQGDRLIIVI